MLYPNQILFALNNLKISLYVKALEKGYDLPVKYSGYSFHSQDTLPLPTKHLSPAQVLRFRDEAFNTYHTHPPFLEKVRGKFGDLATENIKDMAKIKLRVGNELDALIIALLATSLFYGLLWVLFYYGLGNPAHRIFILLGGTWPTGIIQFVTVLAFIWAMLVLGSKSRKINWETNALSLGLLPEEEHKEKFIVRRAGHNLFVDNPDQKIIFQKIVSFFNRFREK